MPNTNIFTGADATLVLAVDDNSVEEGKIADSLITEYDFSSVVGRLQDVRIKVENEVRPYHEIGKRYATELRSGNINITGSALRAHMNGALLKLLLGEGAKSPAPTSGIVQPSFNLVLNLKNPALPDNTSKLVLFGVKFDSWNFTLPEDEFVMESVSFRAMRMSVEETSA